MLWLQLKNKNVLYFKKTNYYVCGITKTDYNNCFIVMSYWI